MKYSTPAGIAAALVLAGACFLPWTYYPDINKEFTGFFSEQNMYGRPGMLLVTLSVVTIVLFAMPKIWAKRLNILFTAGTLAYCFKSYILFTSCYSGICPDKRTGILLILPASLIMVLAAILPDLKLKGKSGDPE